MCSSYHYISPWIKSLIFPVRDLKEWCRISIHRCLRPCIEDSINQLEIPVELRSFLSFKDLSKALWVHSSVWEDKSKKIYKKSMLSIASHFFFFLPSILQNIQIKIIYPAEWFLWQFLYVLEQIHWQHTCEHFDQYVVYKAE